MKINRNLSFTMKNYISILLIAFFLILFFNDVAEAQFRDDLPSPLGLTGDVVRADYNHNRLFGLVDFQMGHSYEMSFGSFGGNSYNQNMYTNTMHLFFNDRLTGRVDLSVLHSPFGNGLHSSQQNAQFLIRNASLTYNFSENSHLTVSYRQVPYSMFYDPFSTNPFDRRFNRNRLGSSAW